LPAASRTFVGARKWPPKCDRVKLRVEKTRVEGVDVWGRGGNEWGARQEQRNRKRIQTIRGIGKACLVEWRGDDPKKKQQFALSKGSQKKKDPNDGFQKSGQKGRPRKGKRAT